MMTNIPGTNYGKNIQDERAFENKRGLLIFFPSMLCLAEFKKPLKITEILFSSPIAS